MQGAGLTHSVRNTFYNEERTQERKSIAECQMQKHNKLSFKEEIKTYVRLAMNITETRTLEDVVEMLEKIYLIPDFSVCAKVTVSIENMNEIRRENFRKCDVKCAEKWSREKYEGKSRWTPNDVKQWRKGNGYTWHERNDKVICDLVPTKINRFFGHLGGVSECKKCRLV